MLEADARGTKRGLTLKNSASIRVDIRDNPLLF